MEIAFKLAKVLAALMLIVCMSALGAIAGATVGAIIGPVKGFRFMFSPSQHDVEERPADKI